MNIEIKMESFENDKLEDLKIRLNDGEEKKKKVEKKKEEIDELESKRTTLYSENNNGYNQISVNMVDNNMSFMSSNNNHYEPGGDHRGVAVFTVLFKGLAVGSYLLLNWLLNDDIILFILVTLL